MTESTTEMDDHTSKKRPAWEWVVYRVSMTMVTFGAGMDAYRFIMDEGSASKLLSSMGIVGAVWILRPNADGTEKTFSIRILPSKKIDDAKSEIDAAELSRIEEVKAITDLLANSRDKTYSRKPF